MISGLIINGLGNWAEVAQHIGTRTKEECEKHYVEVYLSGADAEDQRRDEEVERGDEETGDKRRRKDLMPVSFDKQACWTATDTTQPMDRSFNIDPDEFQRTKKARIEEMRKPQALPTGPPAPLASAPTNHEVAGFMPGRLEFEHEVENDAEVAIKDFEFGLVWQYGGDEQPEAKATKPPEEEDEDDGEEGTVEEGGKKKAETGTSGADDTRVKPESDNEQPEASGSGSQKGSPGKDEAKSAKAKGKAKADPVEPDIEDEDELEVKLALMDIYFSKLDKREDAKEIIFDRGLTEHKKVCGNVTSEWPI